MAFGKIAKAAIIAAILPLTLNASQGSCGGGGGGTKPPGTQPKNRYPIILAHGFGGFDYLAGIPYFYNIEKSLEAQGYQVFATEVSAFNTVEVRATQLANQVDQILAVTGAKKVHLIGHSMGGLDVRYAASLLLGKDKVASVTSIATPHHGTKLADLLWDVMQLGGEHPVLNEFVSHIGGAILNGEIWLPQDVYNAVWNLTSDFTDGGGDNTGPAFNDVVKNLPGVPYFSYTGTSVVNLSLDPTDAFLFATSVIFFPEKNDGMVEQSSTRWGTVVNDNLNANHLDEVNHLLGDTGVFDAIGFFGNLAKKLTETETSFGTLVTSKG